MPILSASRPRLVREDVFLFRPPVVRSVLLNQQVSAGDDAFPIAAGISFLLDPASEFFVSLEYQF